ncbi:DUF3887 domain-containing protein [Flavobacterium sp. CYK-4]|uniref:DUF3887 domain-containing protein n=1 Tax=Flavobacterium lotistagni TaxID=2709660 RepID=UPI00140BC1CC|nr:DUF3887 domain-containing protein [Flavobacterium lotistagni]NHM06283.1 DUF3887 domain-containing protein [Flavobacterium lotistagni]
MKKILLLLFVLLTGLFVLGQNPMQQQAIQTFQSDYNNNDFQKIYQSFSAKMKQARSKQYYFQILSRVKKERGNLRSVEITNYTEIDLKKTRAQYLGHFDYGTAMIRITMNERSQIIGFYIFKENLL